MAEGINPLNDDSSIEIVHFLVHKLMKICVGMKEIMREQAKRLKITYIFEK